VRLLSFEYFDDLIYCDSYDKLVIAVGSVSSTHGVPGLEHCFQLKTVGDAQAIRRRILGGYLYSPNSSIRPFCIVDNFETASLPSTSEEERTRLLSFVVCGGGPTGVETAAVRIFLYASVRSLTHLSGDL
jgi:NADH dehydrogenase FAD-containing subunit